MSNGKIIDAEWKLIQQLNALKLEYGTFAQRFAQWHVDLGRDHSLSDKERHALKSLARQFKKRIESVEALQLG